MFHALYWIFLRCKSLIHYFFFELEREPEWDDPEDDLWCLQDIMEKAGNLVSKNCIPTFILKNVKIQKFKHLDAGKRNN
jgi:hypothetical protein